MTRLQFLREGIKDLKTVGTITRSSRYLCRGMIKPIDFSTAKVIVELGAGDGVLTRHILDNMRPDATLLTFEIMEKFCDLIRNTIHDERLIVIQDSAEHLPDHLAQHGFDKADHILSAIPFVLLPREEARRLITISRDNLKPGGRYNQMHYSLALKSLYEDIFNEVKLSFIPLNIPPAFVLSCSS
jgi:phospholipid N-methyltransferase